eukprot:6733829-Pyramimonas_sp.AAC.1
MEASKYYSRRLFDCGVPPVLRLFRSRGPVCYGSISRSINIPKSSMSFDTFRVNDAETLSVERGSNTHGLKVASSLYHFLLYRGTDNTCYNRNVHNNNVNNADVALTHAQLLRAMTPDEWSICTPTVQNAFGGGRNQNQNAFGGGRNQSGFGGGFGTLFEM